MSIIYHLCIPIIRWCVFTDCIYLRAAIDVGSGGGAPPAAARLPERSSDILAAPYITIRTAAGILSAPCQADQMKSLH